MENRKLSLYHSRGDDILDDECGFFRTCVLVYWNMGYGISKFWAEIHRWWIVEG
mgnify:CR=1 FL=1